MKKATLILAMLAFAAFAMAQKGFTPRKYSLDKAVPETSLKSHHTTKDPGDILWTEDFDGADWSGTSNNGEPVPANTPAGWTIGDDSNNGFYFRWDTVGPRGLWTSASQAECNVPTEAVLTPTQSNGYLMLEADHFNTAADCSGMFEDAMDSYVRYDAGIDFSDQDAVHLVFEQGNRFCCSYSATSDAWFMVSTDGGTSWNQHKVSVGDINKGVGGFGESSYTTEIDITSDVAGESNVIFKFHMNGLSHYYWIIDDVSFVVPMANDMYLWDYWNDYIEYRDGSEDYPISSRTSFTEGFYEYPWFLIQEFKGFHAAFHNFGSAEQTNFTHVVEVWKDGALEETFSSDPIASLIPGYRDTTFWMQDYMPLEGADFSQKGLYTFIHYPSTDQDEEATINDSLYRHMKIGETILSPVNMDKKDGTMSPDNWTNAFDEDGDGLGFFFNLPEPDLHGEENDFYILKGMNVYISRNDNYQQELDLFLNEEARVVVAIYRYNEEDETYTEITSSSERVLTIDDTASIVYVPFVPDGTSEYVFNGGDYVAAIHMYGNWVRPQDGALQSWNIYEASNDVQKRSPESCALVNASVLNASDVSYPSGGAGPAISLDIEFSNVGIKDNENAKTLDFSMYPNPSTGSFNIDADGTSQVTIFNIAGKVVDSRIINGSQNINLDVNSGVYMVRVQNGNKVGTQRLIIE